MSYSARPEFQALDELEESLRAVSDTLASWRRRALQAEADNPVRAPGEDVVTARQRVVDLEEENRNLQARLDTARARMEDLLRRLQFLEEQTALEEHSR